MKKTITESQLRQIVKESIKKVLKEAYDFSSDKPQYDIHGKKWNREYDKASNFEYPSKGDIESEKATKEFLNRPNAARDFKHFPRQSRVDSGVKDYDELKNGSPKIQTLKRRREDEKEAGETNTYLERILKICEKAILPSYWSKMTNGEKKELEELPDKMGWTDIRMNYEEKYNYAESYEDVPPFWYYVAKNVYGYLKRSLGK